MVKKEEALPAARRNYKFLKIKVKSDNNSVNVNIPIRVLTTIREIADRMTAMVPADAQKEMEVKGIDISGIDFARIIEDITNGTRDDPNIVHAEAWDESHKAMVKVRGYVD